MPAEFPQTFGKYVLLRKIALGGMAEIFKAKVAGAEGFEKDLVIKRILPHYTEDDSFVRMFIDEASITAKLQHNNIVQIFDFDVLDRCYYIAMEYIEGQDLKDVLKVAKKTPSGHLSVAQVVWITIETAKALHYAHTKQHKGQPLNIVHRDVSPSNIMLTYNGEVKLMDFGIAKAAERSTKTVVGAVKGKVAYMSPEQARGKQLDGRSDLFALAIIMWEMLTGKRLFLAESDFETLNSVLKLDAPAPSRINPDVPGDLDLILLKALSKDRDERYANAEEFARKLTRWYYSNVVDLEKEKLKPLMQRLFKDEINKVEREADEDRAHIEGSQKPAGNNLESTVNVPAAQTQTGPVSEKETRVDRSVMDADFVARGANEDETRAMPARTDGSTRVAQPITKTAVGRPAVGSYPAGQQQKKSSKAWLWALLALLLAGGGTAAYFAFNDGGTSTDDNKPVKVANDATLTFTVSPHEAKVLADGKAVERGKLGGVAIGSLVRVVAELDGYERYEEVVKVKSQHQLVEVELKKLEAFHSVAIRPGITTATVFVNGKSLGTGPQVYKGKLGELLKIKIVPTTGDPVLKNVVLTKDEAIIAVDVPTLLVMRVTPGDALVSATPGALMAKGGGLYEVTGVPVGASVTVTAQRNGYMTSAKSIVVDEARKEVAMALVEQRQVAVPAPVPTTPPVGSPVILPATSSTTQPSRTTSTSSSTKRRAAPKGKGSIRVGARPWGKVSFNGKPFGTTPVTIPNVKAGSHKVVVTKGSDTRTKRVRVRANKAAKIFVDFTE